MPGRSDARDEDVRRLQSMLAQLGFSVPSSERSRGSFGVATTAALAMFQTSRGLDATGKLDEGTTKALDDAVASTFYVVSGALITDRSASVGGLRVRVVDVAVGRETTLAETRTDDRGRYEVRFEARRVADLFKNKPDLRVEVFSYANEGLAGASDVRYDANPAEIIDVPLTEGLNALASEYATLTQAVVVEYDGKLSELRENAARSGIRYLPRER